MASPTSSSTTEVECARPPKISSSQFVKTVLIVGHQMIAIAIGEIFPIIRKTKNILIRIIQCRGRIASITHS